MTVKIHDEVIQQAHLQEGTLVYVIVIVPGQPQHELIGVVRLFHAGRQAFFQQCKGVLERRTETVQPGIVFFCCGKLEPELAREVNDRDFDVALHVVFTDRAAHDAYQADDMHNRFIAEMKPNWAKVRVFDSLVDRV